jgi:hypothetical protein
LVSTRADGQHTFDERRGLDTRAATLEHPRQDLQLLVPRDLIERGADALQRRMIRRDRYEARELGRLQRGGEARRRFEPGLELQRVAALDRLVQLVEDPRGRKCVQVSHDGIHEPWPQWRCQEVCELFAVRS